VRVSAGLEATEDLIEDFGAALALVLTSFIGVIAGGAITSIVPPSYINTTAAVAFIVIGVLMLLGKI
jgi:putative Ca2+/H+ antiporter (TMEM165/GDT1 family)